MARLLLLLPTASYRAADFLAAARALGAEVVVASERRLVSMGDNQLTLDLRRPEAAAEAIAAVAEERPLDAVVAGKNRHRPSTMARPFRRDLGQQRVWGRNARRPHPS